MMRLRIDTSNPRTFERLVKEGRGQGVGESYTPWLTVRDLSSRGESTRLTGWRTGSRPVHVFSKLERDFFYTLEWDPTVVDCREQFPLDLEVTLRIAEDLNIKHPMSPETQLPVPMTTDFVATRKAGDDFSEHAYSVKPLVEVELQGSKRAQRVKRTLDKLAIEREFWRQQKVKWELVTEQDFNRILSRNVRMVHGFYHLQSLAPLTEPEVNAVHNRMYPQVVTGGASLADLASSTDAAFGLPSGKSLAVAKHLIARRRWLVDFSREFNPSYPITLCS
jgi:hypothetical protein